MVSFPGFGWKNVDDDAQIRKVASLRLENRVFFFLLQNDGELKRKSASLVIEFDLLFDVSRAHCLSIFEGKTNGIGEGSCCFD